MDPVYIWVAVRAALAAGKEILSVYHDPEADFQVEKKADHSPLTIADRRAHQIICSFLEKTPYPVLSEEGRHIDYSVRKGWDTLWIVDPLDGTKEFIKRNGEFTVNIALVSKGVPVAGVIYVPVKGELYFAGEEVGAYKMTDVKDPGPDLSWEQLVSASFSLPVAEERNGWVVVASRSHLTPETEDYIHKLKEAHTDIQLISSGSSLKICLVAEGKADVYPRFAPTMEWDTAAGHAIAKAAGAEIYQAGTSLPLLYNKEDLLNPWFIVEPRR
ncbi:MAG: 3'(2'),5'-bisphosphate nucleotidase CysQ [Bacteroides sp.]|nr:3'(2'),5'-bisphosphate nucleotidase CysQ [Bacteroides sp.]